MWEVKKGWKWSFWFHIEIESGYIVHSTSRVRGLYYWPQRSRSRSNCNLIYHGHVTPHTGLPLNQDFKIPWLFPDSASVFPDRIKVYCITISYVNYTICKKSPLRLRIFFLHEMMSSFCSKILRAHTNKNGYFPWLIPKFPDFSLTLHFPDFSLTSGNPDRDTRIPKL